MFQVLGMIAPLFTLIALGYFSGRWQRIPVGGLAWLNFFVIYLSLPALFFQVLSQTPFEQFRNPGFLVRTTAVTFAVFGLSFIVSYFIRRHSLQISTIQGLAGAYGNFGYLGPPLAIAAFGPEAAVPVALIFCLDNTMHFTLAPLLMAFGEKKKIGILTLVPQVLGRILKHPFMLATFAGIFGAWFQIELPVAADSLLQMLAGAAAPCALFAMGVTAAMRPLKRIPVDLFYLVPFKLILHPLLMFLVLRTVGDVPPVWSATAILLATLPTATNVFVFAQQYDTWTERALSAVVISTLFATITVTFFMYLLVQKVNI